MARRLPLTSHVSLLLTSLRTVNTHLHPIVGCKYYIKTFAQNVSQRRDVVGGNGAMFQCSIIMVSYPYS